MLFIQKKSVSFSYRYKVSTGFFSSPLLLFSSSNFDSRDSHEGTFSLSTSEAVAATSPPRKETKAGFEDVVNGDRATKPCAHRDAVGPVARIAINDKRVIEVMFVMVLVVLLVLALLLVDASSFQVYNFEKRNRLGYCDLIEHMDLVAAREL